MSMALARLDIAARRVELSKYRRSYAGGANTSLTGGWLPSTTSGDTEIQPDLRLLRDRARDRERNGGWPEAFYRTLENNVVGSSGIRMQMKVKTSLKANSTALDKFANLTIEAGWKEWCQKEFCTVTGEDSWLDTLKLTVRSRSRDGGILIRKIRGNFDGLPGLINPFGFAIQLLEIDYLDLNYTTVLPNGDYVFMGVQKNAITRRVVGYHLLGRHPGETIIGNTSPYFRKFYPASEIIHYYYKRRPTQSVGVPDLGPVSVTEKLLDRYEEAEVAAAAEAAMKGGFFKGDKGNSFAGQNVGDGTQQDSGNTFDDLSPLSKDILPPGVEFIPYDPKHPTDAFEPAVKHFLRKIAATGGVSYASLTGDLKDANYSSLRSGKLDEQENYKMLQEHLITHVCRDVFRAWLSVALTAGALEPLKDSSYDRYKNAAVFRGRRWPWVDPEKDMRAALMGIDGGLDTRTATIEEAGGDLEETFDQLEVEQAEAEERGLVFVTPQKPLMPPKVTPEDTVTSSAEK